MTCGRLFDTTLSLQSVINKHHAVLKSGPGGCASDSSVRPDLTTARIPVIGRAVRTEYLVDIGEVYC